MKNQYFGDINDYRKYGLLRLLTGQGEISSAICWMLTPDDGRPDGHFTEYLRRPEKWRRYDPDLFDKLRELVILREVRNVTLAEDAGILHSACFYNEILHDDRENRSRYFETFWNVAEERDLIFFDPDNGLEVKSTPLGRKGSSKYLYWPELVQAFSSGHSVLVYQHFPREKRDAFIARRTKEIECRTGSRRVYAFRTSHVVFFLLPSKHQMTALERNVLRVSANWGDEIWLWRSESV